MNLYNIKHRIRAKLDDILADTLFKLAIKTIKKNNDLICITFDRDSNSDIKRTAATNIKLLSHLKDISGPLKEIVFIDKRIARKIKMYTVYYGPYSNGCAKRIYDIKTWPSYCIVTIKSNNE